MNSARFLALVFSGLFVLASLFLPVRPSAAAPCDPAATDYSGRQGKTLYVSKLGDNSDGSSWAKAFHTIQAALSAVPDDHGGNKIVIRPDTYVEANLYTNHKGAKGSYNLLIGDVDGRLGSGAAGWVVIDSGDPQKGFKSYDWWGPFRATTKGWSREHTASTFSSICWDRWILRNLYVTGGDGGLFWDLTDQSGKPFTVVVEDSVGIGRAFGGGFGHPTTRDGEPSVFRRCHLMSLDWWGDAGALAVGAYNAAPPKSPDAVCEDCTFVAPDNAVQITFPSKYIRLKMTRCRLISLNFSQPQGTPSSGIISSVVADPKQVHIDFEDCDLMGYQVFGSNNPAVNRTQQTGVGRISYTTRGKVRAYVQFQQPVPEGFERLNLWPTELFQHVAPPNGPPRATPPQKALTKEPKTLGSNMETTPVWFHDRLLLVEAHRKDLPKPDLTAMHLTVVDVATGEEVSRFGSRHSLCSAIVEGGALHVFAAEHGDTPDEWFGDIHHFTTTDLKTWRCSPAIARQGGEHLLNTSVCRDENGYLMAYESDEPVRFCFKFARSKDLSKWKKIEGLAFAGASGKEYSACPVVRYFKPYYYVIYLHESPAERKGWASFAARSKDLATWELSPRNPILAPGEGEGCNTSDVDLIEIGGKTFLYYAVGNQADWCRLKRAVYPGPMREFFEGLFPEGRSIATISAAR